MKIKGIRFLWIVAVLLLFVAPVNVSAAQKEDASNTYINPIYQGEEIVLPAGMDAAASGEESVGASSIAYYDTIQKAGDFLREKMLDRTQLVRFRTYSMKSNWKEVLQDVIDVACMADDQTAPEAGDYLRWHFYSFVTSIPVSEIASEAQEGGYTYTFHGVFTYMSTASQEQKVDDRLKTVMSSLKISSMKSEYQVIRAIYCYVTKNVTYDYDNLWNESYLGKYSAYNALCKRTAICQGYANLIYRMCREAGLSVRFIGGYSQGESHAWNIVRLNGRYYNLDSTWDAGQTPSRFQYFLRGGNETQFPDHYRDEEYQTVSFNKKYPMAAATFKGNSSQNISYPLTYHMDKGKNHPDNPTGFFGRAVTLKEPSRQGYTFLGWYTDQEFSNPIQKIPKSSAKGYDLYAKWEKITVEKASIRAFRADGTGLRIYANEMEGVDGYQFAYTKSATFKLSTRKYGSISGQSGKYIRLKDGGRRYYVKVRAFVLDSAGEKVYGKWSEQTTGHQVIYRLNGGVNEVGNPTYYRACHIKLCSPKRKGYRFQGWYLDQNFQTRITSIRAADDTNLVLYAKWVK